MRRFIALVLLALLPLQFSWAAVATVCANEAGGTGHFGHHEHHHAGEAAHGAEPPADGDAPVGTTPGTVDADCGHCHGTCSVMLMRQPVLPELSAAAPRGAAPPERGGAHAPARPERPQWRALA